MRDIDTIIDIIANLDDTLFEKINDADTDQFDLDDRIARNARRRFLYNLKKTGLTEAEWELWAWL